MENGKWRMENGKRKVERGKWKEESGKRKMERGKWKMESYDYHLIPSLLVESASPLGGTGGGASREE